MLWRVLLLLCGVVLIYGHPVFVEDDEGYYEHEQLRVPRSLESLVKKTSRGAISAAREFIKTFLPSASQIGFQDTRRMVKRNNVNKLPGVGLPTTTTATEFGKITGVGLPTTSNAFPGVSSAAVLPSTPSYYYNAYNYQYPGYTTASMYGYGGYPYYNSYAYPYYGNMYTPQYDVAKRTFMPYAYNNNIYYGQQQHPRQSAYQYHYPAEFAAINAAKQSTDNPVPHAQIHAKHTPVPDTSTATGISQGLIDLENDVNGFNQAIQYMKQAFITDNNDGSSDLEEKIHEDKTDVVGDKKDLIKRKQKSSAELIEAFKRTLDSKERLENKLVNYFTNYVCGDDC